METERPHILSSGGASSELFICFTSRLSSSSMKLSKSILSPGRPPRDVAPLSLSSSLSRRLRTNASLKAGQASPFFNRKRGCAFDNPEPSSPKVTCIGQVRVKTKKSRALSKRRNAEVSFRKIDHQQQDGDDKVFRYSNGGAPPQRNQRWVHLPISICEALRTFGAEFSCLFPCRSSCEREKNEKERKSGCGAVFARWLVSVNDGEGEKRREIELVVDGGDEEEEERDCLRSSRRHVFDDIEVRDDRIEVKGRSLGREEGEEEARVSICIPPKNALLLMRCRSDPIKMAALSNNRFTWDAFPQNQDIQEEGKEEEQVEEEAEAVNDGKDEVLEQEIVSEDASSNEEETQIRNEEKLEIEGDKEETEEERLSSSSIMSHEDKTDFETQTLIVEEEEQEDEGGEEEEVESNMSSFEALLDQENTLQSDDWCPIQDEEEEDTASISPSTESDTQETINPTANEQDEEQSKSKSEAPSLTECLLLMMREPKLSMEVSRETWVCSTDFIRPKHEPVKRRLSIDSKPKPEMPPRSSLIEQKLVNAVAYEPFVLTRCKSEPMRSAASKLIPDSCYEPRLGSASSYADPTVIII